MGAQFLSHSLRILDIKNNIFIGEKPKKSNVIILRHYSIIIISPDESQGYIGFTSAVAAVHFDLCAR